MRLLLSLLLLSGAVFQGNAATIDRQHRPTTPEYTGRYIMVTTYVNQRDQVGVSVIETTEFDTAKACLDFIPKMRKYITYPYIEDVAIGCEEKGE